MDVLDTPEMQKNVPSVSVAIIVGSLFAGSVMGFFVAKSITETAYQDKLQSMEAKYMNKIQDMQHQFAIDEVNGARSDMKREIEIIEEKLDALSK